MIIFPIIFKFAGCCSSKAADIWVLIVFVLGNKCLDLLMKTIRLRQYSCFTFLLTVKVVNLVLLVINKCLLMAI